MAKIVVMKKVDDELLRNGRPIVNMQKDTVGTEYGLPSGPLGSKVRVYSHAPEEHQLMIPGKGIKVMSKQALVDYIKGGDYALDSKVSELMRKSNISKAQIADNKK